MVWQSLTSCPHASGYIGRPCTAHLSHYTTNKIYQAIKHGEGFSSWSPRQEVTSNIKFTGHNEFFHIHLCTETHKPFPLYNVVTYMLLTILWPCRLYMFIHVFFQLSAGNCAIWDVSEITFLLYRLSGFCLLCWLCWMWPKARWTNPKL